MKADFKETALAYINKRPLLHVMMIEGLKRGDMEVRYASGSGVLLYMTASALCQQKTRTRLR